ncbi:hypothetical protein PIB30_015119 [Stylosanthes scabra]|uniref:CCHC-type domain-containing protein n=1 Tax=Stylosanthes scabra TaxID=79078 RepID=A0ABU6S723_9FABA|nr:hypothetical protein [Stylosanthes scabra]
MEKPDIFQPIPVILHGKSAHVFAVSDRKRKFCRNCNCSGHPFSECPFIEFRKYKQKGHIGPNCPKLFCHHCKLTGHLITACPTRPSRSDQHEYLPHPSYSQNVPASTAAAATESAHPASSNQPFVSSSAI